MHVLATLHFVYARVSEIIFSALADATHAFSLSHYELLGVLQICTERRRLDVDSRLHCTACP